MKKWLAIIGVLLILAVGVALSPLRYAVRGWFADEQFISGWPTSYWIDRLADKDPGVRQRAISALAQAGPAGENAVPALVAALQDPDAQVRWGAAGALGEIGQRAELSVPALRKMMAYQSAADRRWAVTGIGLIGPGAKEAVPDLVALLSDYAPQMRGHAAWALGRIGRNAVAAIPTLREKVEDNSAYDEKPFATTVGEMASAALWVIDPAYAEKEGIPKVDFPWDRFGMDRRRLSDQDSPSR